MMLDDVQALARVDQHETRRVLAELPRQCRQAAWCLNDVSVAEVTAAIQQRLGPHGC